MENVKQEKRLSLAAAKPMSRDQLLTAGDLFDFKLQLLFEIKTLLKEQNGQANKQSLKSREVRKLLGISPGTLQIQNVVDSVMNQYKYTSLGEFNAVLKLYNITADPGQKGSLMHEKKGLVYRVLDEAGNKIGTPIKASQFYNKPTLKNLEVKFKENEVLRERFALRIKNQIDLAILRKNTLENLTNELRSEAISIIARQTNDGSIYGITFIDHKYQAVFNGSDLGRQYRRQSHTGKMYDQTGNC